jgi:hypothetical protein
MLKALRWLSSEAAVIPDIKSAGAISEMALLLTRDKEPGGALLQKETLHTLYNICQYNKQQHLEVAASANVVGLLCRIGVECLNEREAGGWPGVGLGAPAAGQGLGCRAGRRGLQQPGRSGRAVQACVRAPCTSAQHRPLPAEACASRAHWCACWQAGLLLSGASLSWVGQGGWAGGGQRRALEPIALPCPAPPVQAAPTAC